MSINVVVPLSRVDATLLMNEYLQLPDVHVCRFQIQPSTKQQSRTVLSSSIAIAVSIHLLKLARSLLTVVNRVNEFIRPLVQRSYDLMFEVSHISIYKSVLTSDKTEAGQAVLAQG